VDFTVGYMDKGRDGSAQIDQGVQLNGSLGSAKFGPWKQLQAEVDGCRVQRIDGLRQISDSGVLGVQFPCFGDQHLCEVSEDPPVPALIGIHESCSANGTTNPQMVQLRGHGSQARFDVPQTFTMRIAMVRIVRQGSTEIVELS